MFYRWIVIENSLKDKSILNKYKVLSETKFAAGTPRESRMLKIQVPEKEIDRLTNRLIDWIIYPYYTHFYHEDPKNNTLIVVFSGKKIVTKKNNYQDAISYGVIHGVSRKEMDIYPRDMSQEEW